jgi:hypothetical protein
MTRRELLGLFAGAALGPAAQPPAAPVAIARVAGYDSGLEEAVARLFDQLGGLGRLVKGKTVTIKLNLTGSPALRFEGRPLGTTHYVHPRVVGAVVRAMGQAGARRIRLVESCWATGGPMEEFLLDSGWPVRALASAAPGVEFENTNNRGKFGRYVRFKVARGAWIYPAYDLNAAYEQTDVFVSLASSRITRLAASRFRLRTASASRPLRFTVTMPDVMSRTKIRPRAAPTSFISESVRHRAARRRSWILPPAGTPAIACRESQPSWSRPARWIWRSLTGSRP